MSSPPRGTGAAGPGLLAFLLLCALGVLAAALAGVGEERALTARTTGRVVSGQTDSLAAGGERCRGTVSYEVGGREWSTDGIAPGACPADGGPEDVRVRYDPDAPYVAEVGDPDQGPLGLAVLTGLGATLLTVLLVRSLVVRRRRRSVLGDGPAPGPGGRHRAG